MANVGPSVSGEFPSGAALRPQYMGRDMKTYPVSEPEMDNISSLSTQATIRFSLSSLFLGLSASIWTNGAFYTEWTPEGKIACYVIAPFLIFLSIICFAGGVIAQYKKNSTWDNLKKESFPMQAFASNLLATAELPKNDEASG